MTPDSSQVYATVLRNRRWLSARTFELELSRPRLFAFMPGQRLRLRHQGTQRDYSLISIPTDPTLVLCVRLVERGGLSPLLAAARTGSTFHFTGPYGYFIFRRSPRPAVFVATGVGIAPFVSMVRSGVTEATILHGVKTPAESYYESLFRAALRHYVPCLSALPPQSELPGNAFRGRVTDYLEAYLSSGIYDFYLCGRAEMVRDVTLLVDERFQGSHVYAEIFS